jgi:hypothetical protein
MTFRLCDIKIGGGYSPDQSPTFHSLLLHLWIFLDQAQLLPELPNHGGARSDASENPGTRNGSK